MESRDKFFILSINTTIYCWMFTSIGFQLLIDGIYDKAIGAFILDSLGIVGLYAFLKNNKMIKDS